MPIDANTISWQTILKQPHAKKSEIIQQLFQNELDNPNSNFTHLIILKYVDAINMIQNFAFTSLSLLLKNSIYYDNQHAKYIAIFRHTFNQTLTTYIDNMPHNVQPRLRKLMQAVKTECHTGLLSHNYCFLYNHHKWLFKSSSNFVYHHSETQHSNLIKKSITQYIHQYFHQQEINGHIIKSNLPPYVQFELELYYLTNESIELLNQQWLYQFNLQGSHELKVIINIYQELGEIEPEVIANIKKHFDIN